MATKKTLAEIAAGDDRVKTLKALRDKLAATIDGTESGRDVAALSSRLVEVLDKIAEAEPTAANVKKAEVTRIELIAGKRAERRDAAQA